MAVPSAPAAPVVVSIAARTATATWAHPSGTNPPLIDYQLQLSTRSNFSVITSTVSGITGGSSGVSFGMFNLQRATSYWVRVRARNADGYSAWSSGGAFTTLPEVPGAPRNLSQVLSPISEYAHDRFKAKWSAPSSNGGASITGYDVQASLSPSFSPVAASWSGSATNAQLTGLLGSRGYFVRVRAKNSAGEGPWLTSTGSGTTWDFATAYQQPVAPGALTVSRISDAQHNLTWTLDSSEIAPVQTVRIERWSAASSQWTPVAMLSGLATSWSDTATEADQQYRYRVLTENSFAQRVRQSAYTTSSDVYTTPVAPSVSVARNASADIIVTLTPRASYVTDFEIERRANGGAWANLVTTSALTYTHANPDGLVTHQYRVRAVKGAAQSAWAESATLSLAVPPNPPANLRLAPGENVADNGFMYRAYSPVTFEWDYVAGADGAPQSEFEFAISIDGNSWPVVASGGGESQYAPEGLSDDQWGVRVRTRGSASAGWSEWSDVLTVRGYREGVTPTGVTIVNSYGTSTPDVIGGVPFQIRSEWDYGYSGWRRAEIWHGATLLDSRLYWASGTPLSDSPLFDTALTGGEQYEVRVYHAFEGSLFWSEPAVVVVTADFPVPPAPVVEPYWESETATAVITAVVPDPVGEEVPAVAVRIQRRTDNGAWVLIGEVAPGDQLRDATAPLSDSLEYRGIAVSAVPSLFAGPEVGLEWVHAHGGCPIFVSGGHNFEVAVTAAGMGEHSHAINTVLHQFEGRTKPVAVFGPEESWEVNYSGVLLPDTSTRKEWTDLLNLKQIICYRDCRGRRVFGVIPALKISPANGADWLQFTVTETDYTEGA